MRPTSSRPSRWLGALLALFLSGCTGIPEGLEPVGGFEPERYMGLWFEVARLDHSFERGLTDVTAEYALADDGTVSVINRGYDREDEAWSEATGTASFLGARDVASLSVVFFWPFYGGYHVLALDPDYQWALICGPSRGYLWILCREPTLPERVREDLLTRASAWGFDTETLIWVDHRRSVEAGPAAGEPGR